MKRKVNHWLIVSSMWNRIHLRAQIGLECADGGRSVADLLAATPARGSAGPRLERTFPSLRAARFAYSHEQGSNPKLAKSSLEGSRGPSPAPARLQLRLGPRFGRGGQARPPRVNRIIRVAGLDLPLLRLRYGCAKAVPRLCHGCAKAGPRLCQGCVKAVPRLYQGFTKAVPRLCRRGLGPTSVDLADRLHLLAVGPIPNITLPACLIRYCSEPFLFYTNSLRFFKTRTLQPSNFLGRRKIGCSAYYLKSFK